MSERALIFVGIGVYIVAMLAIAYFASRRTRTVSDFIVAGRSMPLWLCTTTLIATWFGGGMMMGGSGAAYESGLLGVIADPFGATLCLVLVGLFFIRLLRRLKFYTHVDFLQQRYGTTAAVVGSLAQIWGSTFWVASMLVAFGLIFQTLTGTPLVTGIVGGALVVVVYTAVGGMWAVALTDMIQIVIVALGLVILLVVVLHDAGGWGAVAARLPEQTFRLVPLEHSLDNWLDYLRAWFIFGLADIASQSLIQRGLSARTEGVAQASFYLAALGYISFAMIPVTLGIIASVTLPGLEDPESILPVLAIEHLHPAAVAVFVGALLAAIMSSADSALLASASVVSSNLLPMVHRDPSERLSLLVVRWAVPAFGLLAVLIALNARVVYDTMLDGSMLALVAITVPFAFGIWWKRANRAGALAAIAAGLLTWFGASLLAPAWPGDLLGFAASLVAMLLVTPLTQRLDPPRPLVDKDGCPAVFSDRLGTLGLRSAGR